MGKLSEKLIDAKSVLAVRYGECDYMGHQLIISGENYCGHCHRHLNYGAPETEAILRDREELPLESQPLDATAMRARRDAEIRNQKAFDWYTGIPKVVVELREFRAT